MNRKIRNFIDNLRKYGKIGTIRFYFNNLFWGGGLTFNTRELFKYLLKDTINHLRNSFLPITNVFRRVVLRICHKPKVSIIMSVFNREQYLEESIESILNQSFEDFEFLIIDDNSEDSSYSIIKSYSIRDKRVKVFRNQENIGLTGSLNFLIDRALGNYIARIDSDDISLPDRILKQFDFLENHKDIFLVGTGAYNINEKGIILAQPEPVTAPSEIAKMLPINNCIYHPSIMFRNKNVRYRGKFTFSQDYDLYLVLLSLGKKLSNIEEPLIKYRINSESISIQKSMAQDLFAQKAREFYLQRRDSQKHEDGYRDFDTWSIFVQG